MFCTNCGSENPDGAAVCSNCGAPLAPDMSQPAMEPAYSAPAPAPAKSKGPVIAIVVALVAIAAIAAVLFLFVFKGETMENGTYKFVKAKAGGQEMTAEQMKEYGLDYSTLTIEVDGTDWTLNAEDLLGYSGKGTYKLKGDKLTFTETTAIQGGQEQKHAATSYEGTYDKSSKTIMMSAGGSDMYFTK